MPMEAFINGNDSSNLFEFHRMVRCSCHQPHTVFWRASKSFWMEHSRGLSCPSLVFEWMANKHKVTFCSNYLNEIVEHFRILFIFPFSFDSSNFRIWIATNTAIFTIQRRFGRQSKRWNPHNTIITSLESIVILTKQLTSSIGPPTISYIEK